MGGTVTDASDFQRRAAELVAARQAEVAAAGPAPKSRRRRKRVKARPGTKARFRFTLSHVKAIASGMLAVVAARAARFYLADQPMLDQGTETYWIADTVLACAVAYVLYKMIDWNCSKFILWNMTGALIALTTMHNLVHMYPQYFTLAFSPGYVETVLVNTTPQSIVFRGMIIDRNGMGMMAAGEGGGGNCTMNAIGNLAGKDLVSGMTGLSDACF
ncbi:MAG: hypothetical protein AAGP08_16330 [Pseudomonadota bacterium]